MKKSAQNKTIALCCLLLTAFWVSGCGSAQRKTFAPPDITRARIDRVGEVPVIHLYGTPYEMGYQHGLLLRDEVQASVANATTFIDSALGIPMFGKFYARRRLDKAWAQMKRHVPERFLDELQGLSDGSKVPLKVLQRVHAMPELTSTSCSSFAAYGPATKDGRLIQIRNLDWAIRSNVQEYSTLFAYHPDDPKLQPFVSIGWLGFIGVISGISQGGISVGEIGAETVDESMRGIPMPFLLRRVLEESENLEQAVEIVRSAARTVGFNYLFADAKAKRAVALETTRTEFAVFWSDQEQVEQEISPNQAYRQTVPHTLFRSDFAVDPKVRELQTASKGNPGRPGLESPIGSSAYDKRYKGQGILLSKFYGQIDAEIAMGIARAIAPSSNMQSVVYAYPELWVATAEGEKPAAAGTYHPVDLEEIFEDLGSSLANPF